MVEIHIDYEGQLHCNALHLPSGNRLATDAPVDNNGRGEAFSPTDLVATALGTCMATIMGMVPTAIALTEGSEWRSPMAVAVIFGLALSTVLSLVVVPASYCIWDSVETFVSSGASSLVRRVGGRTEQERDAE